jgi:hypothetical protein
MNLENILLSKRKVTKNHILYDPIYMKGPEKVNLFGQKVRLEVFWGCSNPVR